MAEREQESTPTKDDGESVDSDEPQIPDGVLRGIEDIDDGNTASKEEIKETLKF